MNAFSTFAFDFALKQTKIDEQLRVEGDLKEH
jgi:hypothetical protein